MNRIMEDFITAVQLGEVDANLYSNYLKLTVFDILASPEEYVEKENKRREKINEITKNYENIILYGAGKIGRKVQLLLKEGRVNTKIQYYAVTDLKDNQEEVVGIPVRRIEDLKSYKEQALIIICVGKRFNNEVEQNLKRLGFKHILMASDLTK